MSATGCADGLKTPKAGLMGWIRAWRSRAVCRASLRELPCDLRQDVGLDGGLPLMCHGNGGRVFVVKGQPDSTLSGWHW